MGIQSSTSSPQDASNYPIQFSLDPQTINLLQQNAEKVKENAMYGEKPPVGMQDLIEQISGDLNKFDMAFVSNDNRSLILNIKSDSPTLIPPTGSGSLPEGIGGRANPFLTSSFILVLVMVMTELMKAQSKQKLVEKKLDIMAQQWTFELAVRAADEIMQSAKTEATMHYLLAASAGVQIGIAAAQGAVGAGMMVRAIKIQNRQEGLAKTRLEEVSSTAIPGGKRPRDRKLRTERDQEIKNARRDYEGLKARRYSDISQTYTMSMYPMQTIASMTEHTAKLYENMVQAILKVEKARHDAALKIIEGYQDISRRISQTSSESFKEMQQSIDAEADFMTKIIDKNYQSFSYRIH